MKCNAWSFANLDFRGLGKDLSSHREARRQRSAVSDRIRCCTNKPGSFEKQKHPILCTALPWCILTEPRSILSTGQGSIQQRHTRAGGQGNFSLIPFGAACTCSPINLSLSNTEPCVPPSFPHTHTYTNTDTGLWLTAFPAIGAPLLVKTRWDPLSALWINPCLLSTASPMAQQHTAAWFGPDGHSWWWCVETDRFFFMSSMTLQGKKWKYLLCSKLSKHDMDGKRERQGEKTQITVRVQLIHM